MRLLIVASVVLGLTLPRANAMKAEAGLDYPIGVGASAQNFNSNLGFSGAFYVDPILNPAVNNFVSFGYQSLTLRSDTTTAFRVFPIMAGFELPGKVFSDFSTTIAASVGAAFAYLNSQSATAYRAYAYFAAQVRGGVEYKVGDGFSVYARIPVTYLIASSKMSYLTYSFGVNYQF